MAHGRREQSQPGAAAAGLSRRDFLRTGALAATAAGLPNSVTAAPSPGETPPANPGRLAAHRNLFNGDCNFLFYNPEIWQPEGGAFGVRAIERYLGTIADSGIDTLLVNPNTQVAWYPSRRQEHVLDGYRRGDRAFARRIGAGLAGMTPALLDQFAENLGRMLDHYLDLAETGVDWLAECSRICRARGVSPWLSYRMNPTHFSGAPESPVNCRLFRDPANRLSGRIPGPQTATHPAWIGLNYGRQAVRDHMLGLIRDGIENYDFEGIELDWLRHPLCLEAPASPRQVGEMTDWFAAVRAVTKARNPKYLLGIRAPANLAYLRGIGIDLRELVRRGTIDFCTFSNFWQTSWEMPLDELRGELGPDVAIYGGMEDAPNWLEAHAPSLTERPAGPDVQLAGDNAYRSDRGAGSPARVRGTRYLSSSAELIRANAAGKLVLGASGLAQFNFFVTDQVRVPGQRAQFAALRQLANLAFLRGREKHYAFNTATDQATRIWDVPEQLPAKIGPRHRRAFRLPMCAEPRDTALQFVVQVITRRNCDGSAIGVSFNGAWPGFNGRSTARLLFPAGPYSHHVDDHAGWNFVADAAAIRDGWNEVTIYNESPAELNLIGLELGVIRPP